MTGAAVSVVMLCPVMNFFIHTSGTGRLAWQVSLNPQNDMKAIYTVLFFADTAALIKLCYLFLSDIDKGNHFLLLLSLLAGMAASIALLIYLLSAYIDLPSGHRHR